MTVTELGVILSLIGGVVYVTFQITWSIANKDKDKKE